MGERGAHLVTNETNPFNPSPVRATEPAMAQLACSATTLSRSSTTHSLAPRFTNEWKARLRHPSVPPEALPPALKRKFDTANENKERYRRASSSLIRSPSLAVSDDDAGGRSAGASAKVVPK